MTIKHLEDNYDESLIRWFKEDFFSVWETTFEDLNYIFYIGFSTYFFEIYNLAYAFVDKRNGNVLSAATILYSPSYDFEYGHEYYGFADGMPIVLKDRHAVIVNFDGPENSRGYSDILLVFNIGISDFLNMQVVEICEARVIGIRGWRQKNGKLYFFADEEVYHHDPWNHNGPFPCKYEVDLNELLKGEYSSEDEYSSSDVCLDESDQIYGSFDYAEYLKYERKRSFWYVQSHKNSTKSRSTSIADDKRPADIIKQMKFVWVEGGTFLMGSPDDDDEADPDERPVHEVQLSGFWLGKYPVTQEEWEEVMGIEPSSFGRDRSPVEDVSWEDCQQFIHRLNERGLGRFRLPTEAEWEYAARGGQKSRGFKYAGSNKVDEVAWHYYNRFEGRNCVGKKLSNELGLYDMSGNVWEWCDDWYDEEFYVSSPRENPLCNNDASGVRVLRGGSYCHIANYCRSACRDWYAPGSKEKRKGEILQGFGFRLVRLPKD